jgi:hypothetical protein
LEKALAKTAIRGIPRELPHARIYLDDLFEIETILSEVFRNSPDALTVEFEYEVDQEVKLTTHQELQDHEGFSSHFVLNVVSNSEIIRTHRVVAFHSLLQPEFSAPFLLGDDDKWAAFGRIESVFRARESKFKTTCDALPYFPFLLLVVLQGILSTMATHRGYTSLAAGADGVGWIIALSMGVIGWGKWKKNGIYLRNERQDQKDRKKNRDERFEKLVFLILSALVGAVFGVVATLSVAHLKH